jgi:hypothetical protein
MVWRQGHYCRQSLFDKSVQWQDRTLRIAKKLNPAWILERLVSGHDFSRAENGPKELGLQPLRDSNKSLAAIHETRSR